MKRLKSLFKVRPMNQNSLIFKGRCKGPTGKGLIWLKEIEVSGKWISWSNIYLKLCRNWSISKQEVREVIITFSEIGLLEISSSGVRLNYKIKNEK